MQLNIAPCHAPIPCAAVPMRPKMCRARSIKSRRTCSALHGARTPSYLRKRPSSSSVRISGHLGHASLSHSLTLCINNSTRSTKVSWGNRGNKACTMSHNSKMNVFGVCMVAWCKQLVGCVIKRLATRMNQSVRVRWLPCIVGLHCTMALLCTSHCVK